MKRAKKKTGPKTAAGKLAISVNAISHGLVSSRPIIVEGIEDAVAWQRHLQHTRGDLKPVGYIENLLADLIALNAWRLLRAAHAEARMIESRQATAEDEARSRFISDDVDDEELDADELAEHARRLDELADECRQLDRAAGDVEVSGPRAVQFVDTLLDRLGVEKFHYEILPIAGLPDPKTWEVHTFTVDELRTALAEISGKPTDEALAYLAGELDAAAEESQPDKPKDPDPQAIEREIANLRARRLLPAPEQLDAIGRHEGHLNRMVLKNLAALREEQRRRETELQKQSTRKHAR